jgi:malate synthase
MSIPFAPPAGGASGARPVRVLAIPPRGTEALLSPAALAFLGELEGRFRDARLALLARRAVLRQRRDQGMRPDFSPETRSLRAGDWKVARVPAELLDRRVEITGPVERKMIINALNSGAQVFMADFEDANSPTFENVLAGQRNLFDAVRRTIEYVDPRTGRRYALAPRTALLFVRPRGWHLDEKHVELDGRPVSGALLDFGLFLFHNAQELLARGTGPYFYLPKLESHLEARLWNEVFLFAQEALGIPRGTIKATVLIETLPAAFEMHEILWELREHSAGLNCGRWDYIFSFIKTFRSRPDCVLPDRGSLGMDRPFLRAYSELLIQTCHRRGVHAMGGMAAQIPIKDDPAANERAMECVRADKEREARLGHDGTWVAHPGLVELARAAFDARLSGPNQLHVLREDVQVTAEDLLAVPRGEISEAGLVTNLSVGVRYLEAWLRGQGCVPIDGLMEDAATAEISRTQVWQWRTHGVRLADGRTVDAALVRALLTRELARVGARLGSDRYSSSAFPLAAELFERLVLRLDLAEFLTLEAYAHI